MKKPLRILSCPDVRPVVERLAGKTGAEVWYWQEDEAAVTEKIAFFQPDAVILPLFMPGTDAVETVRAYRTLYGDPFPYFAVLCPIVTEGLRCELTECGVSRIMKMPYDMRDWEEMFVELSRAGKRNTGAYSAYSAYSTHSAYAIHRLSRTSEAEACFDPQAAAEPIFRALGLSGGGKGFRYLRSAVLLAAGLRDKGFSVTGTIYPAVAEAFGTTPSCVERHIRSAIARAWQSDSGALIAAYFGNTVDNLRGKPSNSELICMIADRIALDGESSREEADECLAFCGSADVCVVR